MDKNDSENIPTKTAEVLNSDIKQRKIQRSTSANYVVSRVLYWLVYQQAWNFLSCL